jgi:type II secretory pathway pseudopilin PulG
LRSLSSAYKAILETLGLFMTLRSKRKARKTSQLGLSTIELLIVMLVASIVAAFSIPQYLTIRRNMRINGDIRSVAGDVSLAKMRSAAAYTYARVFLFTGQNPYYRVDVWNKNQNCWVPEGIAVATGADCITSATPTRFAVAFSPGVTPGIGNAGVAPEGVLAQAPACTWGGTTALNGGNAIGNSSCVVFNSRGFPVDNTGSPTAGSFYITDGVRTGAVTLNAMGLVHTWSYTGKQWAHQ